VYGNRHAVFEAFGELGALQDPRHRVARAQPNQFLVAQRLQPLAVEAYFGLLRIQDFENLCAVRLGVAVDILARHRRARDVAARGIADERRHVADQEYNRVPEILEMFHLAQQDGVAQMQVGRRGIEAGFHAQRPACLRRLHQAFAQVFFANDLGQTFLQIDQLFVDGWHFDLS
jgi:hypothetical protein